jgi:hypothetical protein
MSTRIGTPMMAVQRRFRDTSAATPGVIASVRPATTRRGMGKIEGSGRWMLMKLRRWRTRPANGARPDPGRD